jgi:hypothetical protein
MKLAFVTAALAAGVAAAALTALVIWILSVLLGSSELWAVASVLIGGMAVGFAVATYVAERFAYRRGLARMRAIGEPWAYREDA